MKFTRIICLILSVFMLISMLSSCKASKLDAPILGDGSFRYIIIRSSDSNAAIQSAVKSLRLALKNTYNSTPTIAKDDAFEDDDIYYEIIVGETNRKASKEAKQALLDNKANCANDFIVTVKGRKVVILALNDDMQQIAVDWFIETFCNSTEDWNKLYEGYQFIYSPETVSKNSIIHTVNGVDIGRYTIIQPRQTEYIIGHKAELFVDYMEEFGYNVKHTIDTEPEEEYEILIGDTQRNESSSLTVEDDNYVIKVVGNKIVIKGGNTLSTARGAEEFLSLLKEAQKSGTGINWSTGHTVNGKYSATEDGAYTLNFFDEFEGSVIDENKWGFYGNGGGNTAETAQINPSSLGGSIYNVDWKNRSAYPGTFTKDYIYLSDGYLTLSTERLGNDFLRTNVATYQTMLYRYGYTEIRAKLPQSPAFTTYWTNGAGTHDKSFLKRFGNEFSRSCMTEIDIMENFSNTVAYATNVHHWWTMYKDDGISNAGISGHNSLDGDSRYSGNSTNNKKFTYDTAKYGDDLSDDFHIYSMYWDDEKLLFAFDGKNYFEYYYIENDIPFIDCAMNYLILAMSMGSPSYGETYNKNIHPTYVEQKIDYVRIYQTGGLNSQMVYAWPADTESGTLTYIYPDHDVYGNY